MIFRCGKIDGAENEVALDRAANFFEPGDFAGTEVDDFKLAVSIDQHVVGFEILMQNLFAVKRAESGHELLGEIANDHHLRMGILFAPCGEGDAFDEFGEVVEATSRALQFNHLGHMRIIDPGADPALHNKTFDVGVVVLKIGRRGFHGKMFAAFGVLHAVDLAPAGGVNFFNNAIAVEHGSHF